MASQSYPRPAGVHLIPSDMLDLRPDSEIDHDILHAKPVSDEKNIWFYWHTGYDSMQSYNKRNVRGWYRRFSRQGWSIRVLDRQPNSPANISNFLDTNDRDNFPQAWSEGTITGDFPLQNVSDLVRFPILLTFGGVYADVGMIQIGDLDRLWHELVVNPASPFQVVAYGFEDPRRYSLACYFLVARRNNPFFERCHRLQLKLWEDKNSVRGLASSPLLNGVPLLDSEAKFEKDGRILSREEVGRTLSDFVVMTQVVSMVMGLVDDESGWNGPQYVDEHIYRIDAASGSLLYKFMTGWDGAKAFRLFSLAVPKEGEEETADQAQAREVVEACFSKSFALKFYHSMITKVVGETLGTLWVKNEGSDDVPQTYAHWLRYGAVRWNQDDLPPRLPFEVASPFKTGPLLREV